MRSIVLLASLVLLVLAAPRIARAEEPEPPDKPSAGVFVSRGMTTHAPFAGGVGGFVPPPRFLRDLFPPALVMRHQRDIGLTEEQRTAISALMKETQARIVDLQWEVESGTQALGELIGAELVDEGAALKEADRLMRAEQELKKAHLALLIRVKNRLTASQQRMLRENAPADVVFFTSRAPFDVPLGEPAPPPPDEPLP